MFEKNILIAALVTLLSFTAHASEEHVTQPPRNVINCIGNTDALQKYLKEHLPLSNPEVDGPRGDFYALPPEIRKNIWEYLDERSIALLGEDLFVDDQSFYVIKKSGPLPTPKPASAEYLIQIVPFLLSIEDLRNVFIVKTKEGKSIYIPNYTTYSRSYPPSLPLGAGYRNMPASTGLISYINSMVNPEVYKEEGILGIQATFLVLSPLKMVIWGKILHDRYYFSHSVEVKEDVHGLHTYKGKYSITCLKSKVAEHLEKICREVLLSCKNNQLKDLINSAIVAMRMNKFPRTIEDVREAARALINIRFFKYFGMPLAQDEKPLEVVRAILYGLRLGPCHILDGSYGSKHKFPINDSFKRTPEEKTTDFQLYRKVINHGLLDLKINESDLFDEASTFYFLENRPAIIDDEQAELFVEYGYLDSIFN